MTGEVRKAGVALLVLFTLLFAQLNNLQLRQASSLKNDPRNTRAIVVDFSKDRGRILAADGTVLAHSVAVDTSFKRLRQYTNGPLYAPVTGFFSFNFGTDGIERTYNSQLAGTVRTITDLSDLLDARPQTKDIHLTVLPAVQQAAAAALGNRRGAVVAIDPRNGGILAMVSSPSFDPNLLAAHDLTAVRRSWTNLQEQSTKPMLPRPYRERYSPGSTFKVVTASAAVSRKPELLEKRYPTERSLDLKGSDKDLPNFGGSSCGGPIPDLLRVSCNTGFGRVGIDVGATALRDTALDFGFDSKPPLDLPAGAESNFPEKGGLKTEAQLATSAIGQLDVSATPLEMALVACGIANGGVVMRPHLMKQITDDRGVEVEAYQPAQWRTPLRPDQANAVKQMMIGVVDNGTGQRAAIRGVTVAGKTGTAQTVGDNAHAWMVAFAPAEAPRVAVAVIVESQPGLGDATGGAIAAPIARATMQAALGASQ